MFGLWENTAVRAAQQGNAFVVTGDGHHLLETSNSPAMTEAASAISPFQINQKQLANLHQSFLSLVKTEGQEESSFSKCSFHQLAVSSPHGKMGRTPAVSYLHMSCLYNLLGTSKCDTSSRWGLDRSGRHSSQLLTESKLDSSTNLMR